MDFSECSGRALQVAIALGRWTGARIKVLNAGPAVTLYPALVTRVTPAIIPTPTRAERASHVARLLEPFVDLHQPVDVILEEGHPAAAITAAVQRHRIDLIVMGTHGRSGLGRLAFGSVAERVVHAASCPVLVVPRGLRLRQSFRGFRRILCSAPVGGAYAHLLSERDRARITTLPVAESSDSVLHAARDARPDLIVWNREGEAIDVLIRKAAAPVLSVDIASAAQDYGPDAGKGAR